MLKIHTYTLISREDACGVSETASHNLGAIFLIQSHASRTMHTPHRKTHPPPTTHNSCFFTNMHARPQENKLEASVSDHSLGTCGSEETTTTLTHPSSSGMPSTRTSSPSATVVSSGMHRSYPCARVRDMHVCTCLHIGCLCCKTHTMDT